mmetsp:Transcript_30783/g.60215  ORF Transcript_30783/g.60215 Transcript_30783/m.60215 type:complete len:481 (+) Transcript_30783:106-1548(+)
MSSLRTPCGSADAETSTSKTLSTASAETDTPNLAGGYTLNVAVRPDKLAARHWTLQVPEIDAAVSDPERIARKMIVDMRESQGEVKACLAVVARGIPPPELRRMLCHNMGDLKGGVEEHLERLGFTDLCSELAAQAASSDPGRKSRAVRNISVDAEAGGSLTAVGVNTMRHLCYLMGFGPDNLAWLGKNDSAMAWFESAGGVEGLRTMGYLPHLSRVGGLDIARAAQREHPGVFVDLMSYMQARTCWIDDVVERFVGDCAGAAANVVLLGAGWDFRLLRLHAVFGDANCMLYEVDAPGTQQAKLKALDRVEDKERFTRVAYVQCDFASECWRDKAVAAGLDTSKATLIVWEGVTAYLELDAVQRTLSDVAERFAEAPCCMAFDHINPQWGLLQAPAMVALGEPFCPSTMALTPLDWEDLVRGCGLRVVEHFAPADREDLYLPARSDGKSVGVLPQVELMMVAGNSALVDGLRVLRGSSSG